VPPTILPVILSGGFGARLWPRSRRERPKQLLPLVTERSLLQETLARVAALPGTAAPPIVVCAAEHESAVQAQVRAVGRALGTLILEPVGRNSAPAVAVAALRAVAAGGPEPILLVLPSDHVILDTAAFASAVATALEPAAGGELVTFGVVPTGPATGYGYIRRAATGGGWSPVAEFVEKPDLATAQRYVASGDYLWNSGMFLFSPTAWLGELRRYAPEMLAACEAVVARSPVVEGVMRLDESFARCPADSIDYAVMEKTQRAAVVPLAAGWNDVGSWSALHDVVAKDADGNAALGDILLRACRNTYVSAEGRLVAAVGLDGVIIVETADAVLVVAREHAEAVKEIAETVAKRRTPGLRGKTP
jgi:mannose-1-phosphate guanylyltransferase / mannose-6-phosphate isomerase